MRYRTFLFLGLLAGCLGCKNNPGRTSADVARDNATPGMFYHYSTWAALVNKVYDGTLIVKEGKTKGDIGLGTYNGADGELIMLDGVMYHVPSTGVVAVADDSMHIPYLNAAFMQQEFSFDIAEKINYDSLRRLLQKQFPSRNFFYAFKIRASFDSLRLGSLYRQERPYMEGLDSLMPKRPKFVHAAVSGTMVGFYCPEFIGDINVAGFHLHFLSDDKKIGGHVMEFTGRNFKVEMDKLTSYQFVLPETKDYDTVNLERKFQYGKK